MERLTLGDILLLEAALEVLDLPLARFVDDPDAAYSDQELVMKLLEWWRPRRRLPWFVIPLTKRF
jgi:hypothetical protein